MNSKTRKYRIRTEDIRDNQGVAPREEKNTKNHLRWFGHVDKRPEQALVRRRDGV